MGCLRLTYNFAKTQVNYSLRAIHNKTSTHYYPFSSKMPGHSITSPSFYRHDYQSQAEDEEMHSIREHPKKSQKESEPTGFNGFELRLYDARIGGWLSPDPYKQHFSPYMAMSNKPFSFIDPDGGYDCDDPPCNGGDGQGNPDGGAYKYNMNAIVQSILDDPDGWADKWGSFMQSIQDRVDDGYYMITGTREENGFTINNIQKNPFHIKGNASWSEIDALVRGGGEERTFSDGVADGIEDFGKGTERLVNNFIDGKFDKVANQLDFRLLVPTDEINVPSNSYEYGRYAVGLIAVIVNKNGISAKSLYKLPGGFTKVKGVRSHGQPVFKKGKVVISPDVDSHIGGAWKAATSVKNLGSKKQD
ncbi:MAG: hypothetical protein JKY48_11805 [Flavobacteriales bacterium]|nr:hypothetical protein [Flavobacteriales bacterium]